MTRRAVLVGLLIAAIVLVLTGRHGDDVGDASGVSSSVHIPPSSPPAASSTQQPTPAAAAATPRPGLEHDDEYLDEATTVPPAAPADWNAEVAASATDAATAALTAFARPGPDVDEDTWWRGVEPTLSATAAPIYASVDPRLVPYTQVQQVQPAQRAGSDLLAQVVATTDAGPYEVLLSRQSGSSSWLVERLRPQERP